MTPEEFVKQYYPFAAAVEASDQVPGLFSIAQSALETGWGIAVIGNAMFGVKDTDGINGNEQLVTTTEYTNRPTSKFPVILSVIEVIKGKRWKYKVKDWFRKYPSPEESFRDHARFLKQNKRYANAFKFCKAPYMFAAEVCNAGYATDPNYLKLILEIMRKCEKMLPHE